MLVFGTTGTAELSAARAGRTLPHRKFLGTDFCKMLSLTEGYVLLTKGLGHLKISKKPTGSRTRNQEDISDRRSSYYTKPTNCNCHLDHF